MNSCWLTESQKKYHYTENDKLTANNNKLSFGESY